MYCSNCGKKNEDEVIFCRYCGNQLQNKGATVVLNNNSKSDVKDYYEIEKNIVPDNIEADEGEVPIKQYNVASFNSTFAKAKGRLQITNKRILFRASGHFNKKSITLQDEFSIDEIDEIELKKDNKFIFYRLFFGGLIIGLIVSILELLFNYYIDDIYYTHYYVKHFGINLIILNILFGILGILISCIVLNHINKRHFCCSIIFIIIAILFHSIRWFFTWVITDRFNDVDIIKIDENIFYYFSNSIIGIFFIIFLSMFVISFLKFCFVNNISINIKIKDKEKPIQLFKNKWKIIKGTEIKEKYIRFSKIIPTKDTEKAIREINNIIYDIKKLDNVNNLK